MYVYSNYGSGRPHLSKIRDFIQCTKLKKIGHMLIYIFFLNLDIILTFKNHQSYRLKDDFIIKYGTAWNILTA